MFYLLLYFIGSITYSFPQYSLMNIDNPFCQMLKDEIDSKLDEIKKQCKKAKEGDEIYESCQLLGPLEGVHCASVNNANDEIAKVSKNTAILIVEATIKATLNLDLNKLQKSTDVVLEIGSYTYQKSAHMFKKIEKLSFDNLIEAFGKLTKTKISRSSNIQTPINIKDTTATLNLVGNIKDKVNTLSIVSNSLSLRITEGDINVENLNLVGITLAEDSQAIKCKKLTVDGKTHTNIINQLSNNQNLVKVDQYGISLDESQSTELQIVLKNSEWILNKKENNDEWKYYTEDEKYSKVSYSIAESVCILSESCLYDINVPDSSVTKVKNVNISSFEFTLQIPDVLENEGKRQLKITKSGDWDGIRKDDLPKITVNYNKDQVEADINEQFKKDGIDVKEEEPYEYPPTKSENKKNIGLIIGVTIACVVVVVVVIVVVVIVIKKKKSQDKSISEGENNAEN